MTNIAVALVRRSRIASSAALAQVALNPIFRIEGVEVVLHPMEIVSVAIDQLGKKVGTLAKDRDRVIAAIDELLTRAWA